MGFVVLDFSLRAIRQKYICVFLYHGKKRKKKKRKKTSVTICNAVLQILPSVKSRTVLSSTGNVISRGFNGMHDINAVLKVHYVRFNPLNALLYFRTY